MAGSGQATGAGLAAGRRFNAAQTRIHRGQQRRRKRQSRRRRAACCRGTSCAGGSRRRSSRRGRLAPLLPLVCLQGCSHGGVAAAVRRCRRHRRRRRRRHRGRRRADGSESAPEAFRQTPQAVHLRCTAVGEISGPIRNDSCARPAPMHDAGSRATVNTIQVLIQCSCWFKPSAVYSSSCTVRNQTLAAFQPLGVTSCFVPLFRSAADVLPKNESFRKINSNLLWQRQPDAHRRLRHLRVDWRWGGARHRSRADCALCGHRRCHVLAAAEAAAAVAAASARQRLRHRLQGRGSPPPDGAGQHCRTAGFVTVWPG